MSPARDIMPGFGPFAKLDPERLASVVVPLNEARNERSASIAGLDLPAHQSGKEKDGLDSPNSGVLAIELLRAEVDRDAAVDDHHSAYDRT